MTTFRWGSATDVGRVREINQDTLLVDPQHHLWAVADGMGGHVGGEVASTVAVEALRVSARPDLDSLVQAVRRANTAILDRAREQPDLQGMGTTLCVVALVEADGDELLAVLNVGDSRVYLLQDGDLLQVSEDHSLVEDMVREGRLTPEEARTHPHRHIITRVLGSAEELEVDSWRITPRTGDRYLLCSDGLVDEVPDDRIAATLRRVHDPAEAARALVEEALEAGGHDNVTVVVVDVADDGGRAERASAALATRAGAGRATGPGPAAGTATGTGTALREPPSARASEGAGGDDDDEVPPAGAHHRRFTWRVAAFVLAVVALLGGAVGFTAWYARAAWFVGFDGDDVAVFQGRPGGVLIFDPTLVTRTDLARADVPPARVADLDDGHQTADRAAAERYVQNLRDEAERLAGAGTGTATGGGGTGPPTSSPTTATTTPGAPP